MHARTLLLTLAAALLAGILGVVASVAVLGPGPLLRSRLGTVLVGLMDQSRRGELALGTPLPSMILPDASGVSHALPHAGRATLINYWATWCGPCREEMPLLDRFASAQSGPAAVDVVGIALDDVAPVRAYLAELPVHFTILIEAPAENDSSTRAGNQTGILPFSVLVDARGRIVARRYGAFQDVADLRDWAEKAK